MTIDDIADCRLPIADLKSGLWVIGLWSLKSFVGLSGKFPGDVRRAGAGNRRLSSDRELLIGNVVAALKRTDAASLERDVAQKPFNLALNRKLVEGSV